MNKKKLFITTSILITVILSFMMLSHHFITEKFTKKNEMLLQEDAENLANNLKNYLEQKKNEISLFTNTISKLELQQEKYINQIDAFMTSSSHLSGALVLDKNGKVFASNSRTTEGDLIKYEKILGKDLSKEEAYQDLKINNFKPDLIYTSEALYPKILDEQYKQKNLTVILSSVISNEKKEFIGIWISFFNIEKAFLAFADKKNFSLVTTNASIASQNQEDAAINKKNISYENLIKKHQDQKMLFYQDFELHGIKNSTMNAATKVKDYAYFIIRSMPWNHILWEIHNILFFINMLLLGALLYYLSKNLKKMLYKIQFFLTELKKILENITTTSLDVTHGNNKILENSSIEASAIQNTAASTEEITAMLRKSLENAKASNQLASESLSFSNKSKDAVGVMVQNVQDIQTMTEEFNTISRIVSEIGSKTKVINDIVFQTKLLSFNASVEAARAGEHGKGFAVVAQEIGNLAQMSGNAAKEISQMIDQSTQAVQNIVQKTTSKVTNSLLSATECNKLLEKVVQQSEQLSTMINSITMAANEQTTGVEQINTSLRQLENVTNSNISEAKNTLEIVETLSDKNKKISDILEKIETLITSNYTKNTNNPEADNPTTPPSKILKIIRDENKKTPTQQEKSPLKQDSKKMPSADDPRFIEI